LSLHANGDWHRAHEREGRRGRRPEGDEDDADDGHEQLHRLNNSFALVAADMALGQPA
jgi:hypothetical protein